MLHRFYNSGKPISRFRGAILIALFLLVVAHLHAQNLQFGGSYDQFSIQGNGNQTLSLTLTDCGAHMCMLQGSAYGTGALQSTGSFMLVSSDTNTLTLTSSGSDTYTVKQPTAWWLLYQSSAGTLAGLVQLQQVQASSSSGQAVATGVLSGINGSLAPVMNASAVTITLNFYDGNGLQSLLGNSGSINASLAPGSGTGTATSTSTSTSTATTSTTTSSSGTTTSLATNVTPPSLDSYGGLANVSLPVAATGYFQVKKIGSRWIFIDPDGHPYWMLGVFDVNLNTESSTGATYVNNKYGSEAAWGLQAVRRLQSWGFNSTSEYSSAYVVPLNKNGSYETTDPMPWVDIARPAYYSLIDYGNYASAPVKDLVNGLDSVYQNYRGDGLPDVFDPNFQTYANGFMKAHTSADEASSPWLIGTATDDLDDLWGFGPGPDLPAARSSSNIGWLVLCTDFQQTSSSRFGISYSNPEVYSKYELASWLQGKYSTIAALNQAWGSNYTTFGDAGGYGTGTGLLDEDGRDAWVGNDDVSMSTANSQVRADLNAFLTVFVQKYFAVVTGAIRAARPNQLVFGPCTLNGWGGVSRQAILAAAGQYTDVIQASMSTQQDYDLSLQYAGDHPFVTWTGMPANPDSDLSTYANPNFSGVYSTQSSRGLAYAQQVENDFQYTGSSAAGALQGSQNVVGSKFWAWTDAWGEKTNWGIVSFMDNAYDGVEDVTASGKDQWGYVTGGESANYGDFVTPAKQANLTVLNALVSALP